MDDKFFLRTAMPDSMLYCAIHCIDCHIHCDTHCAIHLSIHYCTFPYIHHTFFHTLYHIQRVELEASQAARTELESHMKHVTDEKTVLSSELLTITKELGELKIKTNRVGLHCYVSPAVSHSKDYFTFRITSCVISLNSS